MKSIDLFAGCGGLSLGLEMAGFETVFVNELHEDAWKNVCERSWVLMENCSRGFWLTVSSKESF